MLIDNIMFSFLIKTEFFFQIDPHLFENIPEINTKFYCIKQKLTKDK
jgi:hypothetical protein